MGHTKKNEKKNPDIDRELFGETKPNETNGILNLHTL